MPATVPVDVYADIACPWCYVGRAHLKQAIEQSGLDVPLRWRPFQLQPNMPSEGRDFRSVLERKFGGWNRAERMFERIQAMGREDDLVFDFDAIEVAPNTADAHRLVLWAQDRDAGDAMATRLFRAYFSEGKNVSDRDVLVGCAADIGLDEAAARDLLEGEQFAKAVRESQEQARRWGITGVPCYVFDGGHAVTGAQPVDVMAEALDAATDATT